MEPDTTTLHAGSLSSKLEAAVAKMLQPAQPLYYVVVTSADKSHIQTLDNNQLLPRPIAFRMMLDLVAKSVAGEHDAAACYEMCDQTGRIVFRSCMNHENLRELVHVTSQARIWINEEGSIIYD